MGQSIQNRREPIYVINVATGEHAVLIKSTPVVTETYLDGSTNTFENLATITDRRGEHVNRVSDDEFASLSGVMYKRKGA